MAAPPALTKCGPEGYESTRAWARTLRRWVPQAQGVEYRPRHDEDGLARALFEGGAVSRVGDPLRLGSAQVVCMVRDIANTTFQ